MVEGYRYDEVCEYVNAMQKFYKDVMIKLPNTGDKNADYDYKTEVYCQEAYRLANMEYTAENFQFFQSFQYMRWVLTDSPKFKHYYIGYENYINSNQ